MPTHPKRQENFEHFEEKYSRTRSDASRAIEREVLGSDLGVNGYTTATEVELLAECVDLGPGAKLLDLGSGRGWPGLHLVQSTACTLFTTDIPLEALEAARDNAARLGREETAHVIAADGRAIPFGSDVFDAVTHADVLC